MIYVDVISYFNIVIHSGSLSLIGKDEMNKNTF